MTYGQKRMRVPRTASNDAEIIKEKCGELIDIIMMYHQNDSLSVRHAIKSLEEASLWAIKAIEMPQLLPSI